MMYIMFNDMTNKSHKSKIMDLFSILIKNDRNRGSVFCHSFPKYSVSIY